jgi:hypothetical protein
MFAAILSGVVAFLGPIAIGVLIFLIVISFLR